RKKEKGKSEQGQAAELTEAVIVGSCCAIHRSRSLRRKRHSLPTRTAGSTQVAARRPRAGCASRRSITCSDVRNSGLTTGATSVTLTLLAYQRGGSRKIRKRIGFSIPFGLNEPLLLCKQHEFQTPVHPELFINVMKVDFHRPLGNGQ